ncbi:hypothetical protein V1515DRAFT_594016 [Lipomyces mesembrius]
MDISNSRSIASHRPFSRCTVDGKRCKRVQLKHRVKILANASDSGRKGGIGCTIIDIQRDAERRQLNSDIGEPFSPPTAARRDERTWLVNKDGDGDIPSPFLR